MLKIRVISAAVGLPILIAAMLYLPPLVLSLLFMVIVMSCVFETLQMIIPKLALELVGDKLTSPPTLSEPLFIRALSLTAVIATFVFIYSTTAVAPGAGRGVLVAGLLTCIFAGTFIVSDTRKSGVIIISSAMAIIYGVLPWVVIWDILQMGDNARYLFYLLGVVWSGDTGAYFGGRYFGKHPLAPVKSPKKTWEGAISGLLASLGAALVFRLGYGESFMSWNWIIVSALSCGIVGQMGDLVESNMKRLCGVKDSGGLIPGHGGVLDRTDGLLFAGPVLWFILYSILK